ncbi:TPA: RICIN domain-containing protein [Bacillus cereus]
MKKKIKSNFIKLSVLGTLIIPGTNSVFAEETLSKDYLYKVENQNSKLNLQINDEMIPSTDKFAQRYATQNVDQTVENQKFMLVQLDGGYYVIANKKSGTVSDALVYNGDYFKYSPFRYMLDHHDETVFNIGWTTAHNQQWNIKGIGDDKYKIINRANSKVLTVDEHSKETGADVIAYNDENALSQQWRLKKDEKINMPLVPKKEQLGDIPHYTGYSDNLPDSTKPVVVGSTMVPYFAVNDTWSAKDKIDKTPYYNLIKKQYWQKIQSHVFAPHRELTMTSKYGISKSSVETMRNKLGITTTITGSFEYGKKDVWQGAGSISVQIAKELETTVSHTTNESTEKTVTNVFKNPSNGRLAWSKYALVTEYSLERADGTLVSEPWKVVLENDTRETTWPNNITPHYTTVKVN